MKLSIIVPVYNMGSENKLNHCMDSLVAQTVSDFEILAVNDASTDNSLEILRDYEARYPGLVKVITYPDNRRQGGAKNEGLRHAVGEWIGFIDSDDWITPDYYERLILRAEETGADIVGCTYSVVNNYTFTPGRVIVNNTPDQTGELDLETRRKLVSNFSSMVIKVYKASVIKENNLSFPEHIFYEDNCAAPIWAMYFKHFELIDEPLYFYYQHSASTVHTVTEDRCRDRLTACEIMLDELKKRGFYEQYKTEVEIIFIRTYFINTLFGYMIGCKHPRLSFVRKILAGMLEAFPDFTESRAFSEIADAEQVKMTKLMLRNTAAFYIYYRALWCYRNAKKK